MTRVQQTYLELLKTAIWNQDVQLFLHPDDLQSIIQLSAFQGTGPFVFDQLLKLKDAEIPDALRMQMKQQCMMSMMQQNTMLPILSQAWNALENAGINPVLLKGLGLAQYYPQPYLRQWGDMDVYVGQKNYHLGCETLRAAFPGVKHMAEEGEDYKHYNFEFGNTVLEMHRVSMTFAHPRDRKYYEDLEARYLTKDGPKIVVEGLKITLPEDTFNVFFTFLHAWHHFEGTGMNFKQLCDIAVLLHTQRDTIDRDRLKGMLSKLHLMDVWQLIIYVLVQYLGLSKDESPFYTELCKDRADLLFERLLKESTARMSHKKEAENMPYLKRKLLTLQSRFAESNTIKPYSPKYARHMLWSAIVHGIERTVKRK